MATSLSIFGCFSGSNKVASQGDDSSSPRKPSDVKATNDAKPKRNDTKKSPPIPISHFSVGTRLSLL
ncbi:hypothetical protein V6N12_063095 [Hibiscus sabdariffa]|uniref:Uncharacterized protein n=1 Tax=Hibiscus sabdariffa TaxID=183260 RepID=A0ABR2FAT8_9ROSI